jgi:hypothetical protein
MNGKHKTDGDLPEDEQPRQKRVKVEPAAWRVPEVLIANIVERTAVGAYRPTIWTRKEIRRWCRDITTLATTSKSIYAKLEPWLKKAKNVLETLALCDKSQDDFERDISSSPWPWPKEDEGVSWFNPWIMTRQIVYPSPVLIDIFLSGKSLSEASFLEFYDGTAAKFVPVFVSLMPESLHCRRGTRRCRLNATPLIMAVLNEDVPTKWITILLQLGSDPDPQWRLPDGTTRSLLEDIDEPYWCRQDRAKEIKDILKSFQR